MTVNEMIDNLSLTVLTGTECLNREVHGCYCGDLLSWVMSRAKENDAWLTVMGNVNAIAVASLTDTACIILTENAALDEEAKEKALQHNIIILQTEKNSYETAVAISNLLRIS